jgi:predicted site-specific integrase-resolvase
MVTTAEQRERCYTMKEAGIELKVCQRTVSRLMKAGKLEYVNVSDKTVRIPDWAIAKFLRER